MNYELEFDNLFADYDAEKVKKDATYFKIKNDLELKDKRVMEGSERSKVNMGLGYVKESKVP